MFRSKLFQIHRSIIIPIPFVINLFRVFFCSFRPIAYDPVVAYVRICTGVLAYQMTVYHFHCRIITVAEGWHDIQIPVSLCKLRNRAAFKDIHYAHPLQNVEIIGLFKIRFYRNSCRTFAQIIYHRPLRYTVIVHMPRLIVFMSVHLRRF